MLSRRALIQAAVIGVAQISGVRDSKASTEAASNVIRRSFGSIPKNLSLELIPRVDEGRDVFEISASAGRALISGSSTVAICRGFYTYLRTACTAMFTWSGRNGQLPDRWPSYAATRVVCPYRFTQYFNPCTFGYSTPFWGWDRWERELDWMALHGINMPLAMTGQEAIWQRTWASFGVSRAEWDRFTTGPAHLPWHRMGNINRFDGPLPQSWVDRTRDLQKKIIDRMLELGMHPIVPGFAGHVPEAFLRLYPKSEVYTSLWGDEAPRLTKTFLLHPKEAQLYREIGKRFIEEYRREFGPVSYYLADSFNEMRVPVSQEHRYEDLKGFASNIYGGIRAGDPDGIWVIQSWLFGHDPGTWDAPSTGAFLSGVPDDKLLILDYSADLDVVHTRDYGQKGDSWSRLNAYSGKQWINGMAHTFGGNNNVKGNLPLIAFKPALTLADPKRGRLAGWGIDMEGIENNEVVFELLTDVGWTKLPVDLKEWIPAYCKARYGAYPQNMQRAWDLLLSGAYSSDVYKTKHAFQSRPSLTPKPQYVNTSADFQSAVALFLSCAQELGGSVLFQNELIELVVQAAGGHVDSWLLRACEAHTRGDQSGCRFWADQTHAMLLRLDGLLHVRPDRRLESWVQSARAWATTPDEAAYYDGNARLLITYWGWASLEDYASRLYSGLIRDYYAARWQVFFRHLTDPAQVPVEEWEQGWLSTPYQPSKPFVITDLFREARQILEDCKQTENRKA